MTRPEVKDRAFELAAQRIGPGRITRIGHSLLAQVEAAMREAADAAIMRAIARHRRGTKTLGVAVCEPLPPTQRAACRGGAS